MADSEMRPEENHDAEIQVPESTEKHQELDWEHILPPVKIERNVQFLRRP